MASKKTGFKMMLILFAITVFTVGGIGSVFAFSDLDEESYSTEYIMEFTERGLIFGYSDGTFRPNNSITRAEFLTLINRTFGYKEADNSLIAFTDISESDWYYNDLTIAIHMGYIKGYVDKSFRPNRSITRQEAALVMNRILGYEPLHYYELEDEVASWAKDAVYALLNTCIMTSETGRFDVERPITREETVVSLLKVLHQKELALQLEEENNSDNSVTIEEGSTPPSGPEAPPADVIYAMNMTIEGLTRVLLQQNKYSQALDANQLDMVVKIRENMVSYLADYSHDYESQAQGVNTRYKALSTQEQNELKNAINYDVAYKYLSLLEKYFEQ